MRVTEVGDGQVAYAWTQAHRPELVILDWLLPRLDGLTLCRLIKTDPGLANTRVLICTTLFDADCKQSPEWDGYLTKPCEPALFLDTVCHLLGR